MKKNLLAITALLLLSLCLCAGALADPPKTALGGEISFKLPTLVEGDVGVEFTTAPADPIEVTLEGVTKQLPGTLLTVTLHRDEIDWVAVRAMYNFSISPEISIPNGYTHCINYGSTSFPGGFGGMLDRFPTEPGSRSKTKALTPYIDPMQMDTKRGLFIPIEDMVDEDYGNFGLIRWYNENADTDKYADEYLKVVYTFDNAEPFMMSAYDVPAARVFMNTESIVQIEPEYKQGCVYYTLSYADPLTLDATKSLKTRIAAPEGATAGTVTNNEYADTTAELVTDTNDGKLYCELTTYFYDEDEGNYQFYGGPGNKEYFSITWKDENGDVLSRETIDCEMRYDGFPVIGSNDWDMISELEIDNPLDGAGVACNFSGENALLSMDFSGAENGKDISLPITISVEAPEGAAQALWMSNTTDFWDDSNFEFDEEDCESDDVVNGVWTYSYELVDKIPLPGSNLSVYFSDGMQDTTTYIRWLDANGDPLKDEQDNNKQNFFRAFATGVSTEVVTTNSVAEEVPTDPVEAPTVFGKDGWKLSFEICHISGGNGVYYELKLIDPSGKVVTDLEDEVSIYLPYPAGTSYLRSVSYRFTLNHYNYKHTHNTQIELTPTEFGLYFTTKSFSPFVVESKKKAPPVIISTPTPTPVPTPIPTPTPTPIPDNAVNDPDPDDYYPDENAPDLPEMNGHPGAYYAPDKANYALTLQGGSDDIIHLVMFKKQKLDLRLWDKTAEIEGAQWTSSDEQIFTVNAKGKLTAKKTAGKAYLLGIDETERYGIALIEVTDKDKTPNTVTVKPKKIEIAPGETAPIEISTKPTAVAARAFWHSLNPQVATVENGVVTGVKDGKAEIIVRVQSGKYAKVTVVVASETGPQSIKLKKAVSIKVGEAKTLHPTIKPKRERNAPLVWTSSDETIATVDATGTVTGIAPGQATITASCENGLTASCVLTVK